MKKVSLDPYRSKGVKVFSGTERGKVVGEHIKRNYGDSVIITIPKDVYVVTRSFKRGLSKALTYKLEKE